MNRLAAILFFAVVAAQVAGLLAFAGVRELALARGLEVTLQTVPVDPRSLLQGDYAILDYEIAAVPSYLSEHPAGTVMYVALTERGGLWHDDGYYVGAIPSGNKPYLRGVVNDRGRLDFGIGTYFVPEGTGQIIERADDVKVVVSVNRNGRAVIRQVLVDGAPFAPDDG